MYEMKFKKVGRLSDGVIDLRLENTAKGERDKGWVPYYTFRISPHGQNENAGYISLRIGYTEHVVFHAGHIGYNVRKDHRGQGYAARACRLARPLAIEHGMDVIWITCDPDNWPSRKTCENIGAHLVDIVDVPRGTDMYNRGEIKKCRYRWILFGNT